MRDIDLPESPIACNSVRNSNGIREHDPWSSERLKDEAVSPA